MTNRPWINHPTTEGAPERLRYCVDDAGLELHFELHDSADGEDDNNWPMIDGEARICGVVKWDGCLNWMTHKNLMCHFCGPADSARLHEWFLLLWRLASTNLTQWMGDMEGMAE